MVDTRFFPFSGPARFGTLCAQIGIVLPDDDPRADVEITGAGEPSTVQDGEIALVANKEFVQSVGEGQPGLLIVGEKFVESLPDGVLSLAVAQPHVVFAQLLDLLYPDATRAIALAVSTGSYDPKIEGEATIAPGVVFGPDVEVGAGTVIGPGTVIGRGVTIGRNCVIGANVTIDCAHVGDRVVIWSGVRIGTEGFGWLDHGGTNRKIPQLGRVIIQDRVEIGANSTIDRGALSDTVIGEGTKIDNLVQIGHNCKIGRNCLIAAMSGISGSTIVGDSVLMGGGVGTSGHLSIGAGSVLYGRSAVTKDWPAGSKLAGAPAQDIKDFWRELAQLRRLGKGDRT